MATLESKIKVKIELRPCLVSQNSGNGIAAPKAALFHKWIDKEEAILKFNEFFSTKYINAVVTEFRKNNTLPNDVELIKNKRTLGLVEYEDGKVAEVEPTRIKFVDNKIKEYAF